VANINEHNKRGELLYLVGQSDVDYADEMTFYNAVKPTLGYDAELFEIAGSTETAALGFSTLWQRLS